MSEAVHLIGLSGLGKSRSQRLGEIDTQGIIYAQVLDAVKRLPDGDAVELIKQLPKNVLSKICTEGVKEQITDYLPQAFTSITAGLLVGLTTKSFLYGSITAIMVAGILYFIFKPHDNNANAP